MPAQISTLTSGHPFACEIASAEGNILKLSCSNPFLLRAPVKVENAATLWMGEVWACEPEGTGFSIEIEVSQVLRDPGEVERMAARFRQAPNPEETPQKLA